MATQPTVTTDADSGEDLTSIYWEQVRVARLERQRMKRMQDSEPLANQVHQDIRTLRTFGVK